MAAAEDAQIPAYEALRQQVLGGQLAAARGLSILLTRGLSAWITARLTDVSPEAAPVATDRVACPSTPFGNVELIHLLCDMTRPHYAAQELS